MQKKSPFLGAISDDALPYLTKHFSKTFCSAMRSSYEYYLYAKCQKKEQTSLD